MKKKKFFPWFVFRLIRKCIRHIKHILKLLVELIFVLFDSKLSIGKKDRVLFIDLGANQGQGYDFFSRFFKDSNIDFELFEPNPYCCKKLKEHRDVKNGKIVLNSVGVGIEAGTFKFYGLNKLEGGKYSQGGSILQNHNSLYYATNESDAIEVEIIDFGKYLTKKTKFYNKIIIKMDIEGAEVDILEKLISTNLIQLIDILYVEFHSQYQEHDLSIITKKRETKIINSLRSFNSLSLRIWH